MGWDVGMRIDVLTLFPAMIEDGLNHSIIKRAMDKKSVEIEAHNIRDFSTDKHSRVDDTPYGGGAGMVMQVQPIESAIKSLELKESTPLIYVTPKGKTFNQEMAQEFSKAEQVVFLCGHYEGVDQRVIDTYVTHEVSIGDYVLTGGELPAMVMIDAIVRLLDGVLGDKESHVDESFNNGLLEYPHYTRPADYSGMKVPDVLLSGNHKKIEEWRLYESIRLTFERRPDLLKTFFNLADLSNRKKRKIQDFISSLKNNRNK
jgi:tRNA (guanine37-N1)-methyltransferase